MVQAKDGSVFTSKTEPVFALINLPEVVKGALMARYSRSAQGLREIYDAEFKTPPEGGEEHAEGLYARVLGEYGDDSVAQLGSAHVCVERASNVATKIIERGRLMSYLEQSTRYIRYDQRSAGGGWRWVMPPELTEEDQQRDLRTEYGAAMNEAFATYAQTLSRVERLLSERHRGDADAGSRAHSRAIRAGALDVVRPLLPAATAANVGIHGSGQSFEALLMRLGASPLLEARRIGRGMQAALKDVIPAFIARIDEPDRGLAWMEYLRKRERAAKKEAQGRAEHTAPKTLLEDNRQAQVRLINYDQRGEANVAAATLAPHSDRGIAEIGAELSVNDAREIIARATPRGTNRRHKAGRGFEYTNYLFEIVADYGVFRDLQRHRMLTIDWQPLGCALGSEGPPEVVAAAGLTSAWQRVLERCAAVHEHIEARKGAHVAQYPVPMAYRIRFTMQMNAREAMHMLELRTQPAGHSTYRRICQQMHKAISEVHPAIGTAMRYVDHNPVALGRLGAERRSDTRRGEAAGSVPV